MIRSRRPPLATRKALLLASLACVCLLPAAAATAAEGVLYVKESVAQYERQLAARQIAAATINKRIGTVRLTLKNGEHFLLHYGRHQEPTVAAALQAKGVAVTVLKPAEALKEAKKPVKHKLRYIAGGILIAVIIVVGAVLLVDRRRKAAMD
jgi:hypothetical protein